MVYLTLNDHNELNVHHTVLKKTYNYRWRHTLMFTMFTEGINQERGRVIYIDVYTTRGVSPWWSVERMHVYKFKHWVDGGLFSFSFAFFSSSARTTTRCRRCRAATQRRPASCWWGSCTPWCRTWVRCQTTSASTWSCPTTRTVTHSDRYFNRCRISWSEPKGLYNI